MPRKGGARLYVTSGMLRETTQGLGRWKLSEVAERVNYAVRAEDVAPEMPAAVTWACDSFEMEWSIKELSHDPALVAEGEVGLSRSSFARRWFSHYSRVSVVSTPDLTPALQGTCLSLMGKRVRSLKLPDGEKRVLFNWGSGYKEALSMSRRRPTAISNIARDRDSALSSDSVGLRRVSRLPPRKVSSCLGIF